MFPGLTPEQLDALPDPKRARSAGLPTIEHGVRSGSWFCGPPELVTEKLLEVQDRYPGLEEVNIGVTSMGMPLKATLEQLSGSARKCCPGSKPRPRCRPPPTRVGTKPGIATTDISNFRASNKIS